MPSLVNETLGAAFVHIPKTAGTALTEALRAQSGGQWVQGDEIPGIEPVVSHNMILGGRQHVPSFHARAVDLRHALGWRRYDALHSFAVVRNPFERMSSVYHYTRETDANPHSVMCREIGFEQFIVFHCMVSPQFQADWLLDLQGRMLVSELFRLEEMEALGAALGERFAGRPLQVARVNASSNAARAREGSWNVVPDWVVALFVDTFARDFEVTGYAPGIGDFKTADVVSEAAESGAWERLARWLVPQMGKAMVRAAHLDRKGYVEAVVKVGKAPPSPSG